MAGTRRTSIPSLYPTDAFSRLDESEDGHFFGERGYLLRLDSRAARTARRVVGTLVTEKQPKILELMAAESSHIPESMRPSRVVGIGPSRALMQENPRLDEAIDHDLNTDPMLPFPNDSFDVVISAGGIQYLTQPFEIAAEVARVLVPGGLFLMLFSNRGHKPKTVRIWRQASEQERVMLAEDLVRHADAFGEASRFVSKGKPRPKDDPLAGLGMPSDPVWAVYADKKGANRVRPGIPPEPDELPPPEELARRKERVRDTLRCPYCQSELSKWKVPDSPFTEWSTDYMYICFNNDCPYLVSGWDAMDAQGNAGFSYRLMYNPDQDACMPVPVPNLQALKEYVVAPRG